MRLQEYNSDMAEFSRDIPDNDFFSPTSQEAIQKTTLTLRQQEALRQIFEVEDEEAEELKPTTKLQSKPAEIEDDLPSRAWQEIGYH